MRMRGFKNSLLLIASALAIGLGGSIVCAQSSSFTYQGRLADGGSAATGNYDLQFALWDSASGGAQVGSTLTLSTVAVSEGVFSVTLDFGAGSFNGANRFLEISARPVGGAFTLLSPRQPVTATPYAIRSVTAAAADTATNATTATNAAQLGGVAASQYVQTNDSRLTDPRPPTAGSLSYIQNSTNQQSSTNFNISGNGVVGGTLSGSVVNATNQYNIGGVRVLTVSGDPTNFPNSNTFAGSGAGAATVPAANADGNYDSMFGFSAGAANTTGRVNSFFGTMAGISNTTGSFNSFFGAGAGAHGPSASENSYFGANAGVLSTGSSNSFFGTNAGNAYGTGDGNSFVGELAGAFGNGSRNTFIGQNSGFSSSGVTGDDNTMLGSQAMAKSSLSNSTAVGANAMVTQSNSLVLGSINGVGLGTADTKVGIGTSAPTKRLEVGTATVADGINLFGTSPAYYLSDANNGEKAAWGVAKGAGFYSTDALSGDTVLRATTGRLLLQRGSPGAGMIFNSAGTVSVTTLGSAGGTSVCRNSSNEISTCSSSLRYKTNVLPYLGGLGIINRLRPISFTWKAGSKRDIGLGAEEVEKVEPLLTFRNDKGEIEGVKYNELSAVFINAFKEQQTEIEELKRANVALNERLKSLERRHVSRGRRRSS